MKMKNSMLAAMTLVIFAFGANGQSCTGCTITISSLDSSPIVVPAGTTLCITTTGEVTGDIAINGGEVCNEGIISSSAIAINSGTLNNYGVIASAELAIVSGSMNNYGIANIPSFGLGGADISVSNGGLLTTDSFALAKAGLGTDPIFYNYGRVEAGDVANGINCTLNNAKDFICTDLANALDGSVYNSGYMSVSNECANTGYFFTECIVQVGSDFVNTGTVEGPTYTCGGFSVGSISTNIGSYGADGSNLDICTTLSSGFTVNTGTLGSGVTICSCSTSCEPQVLELVSEEEVLEVSMYPNPMKDVTTLEFNNPTEESHTLLIFNIQGKLVMQVNGFTSNRVMIEKGDMASGLYIVQLSKASELIFSEKLIIE